MKNVKVSATVVKRVDPKKIDELVARVKGLDRVLVGVPSGSTEEDGTPTALVAAVHEYGAPSINVPERPFLRNTIRANLAEYKRLNRVNIIKVLQGKLTMDQALGQLGMMAKGHVQAFIYSNTYTLKDATIAAKGSSRALVDTGQLVQSINYEITTGELS